MRSLIFSILFFSTFFIGCRKGDFLNEQVTAISQQEIEKSIAKVKSWLNFAGDSSKFTRIKIGNRQALISKGYKWSETKMLANGKLSLTPIQISSVKDSTVYNFLLANFDRNGKVTGGHIVSIINGDDTVVKFEDITTGFLSLNKIPENFTGSIIYADIYDNVLHSYHIEKGKVTDEQDFVVVKQRMANQNNNEPVTENAPPPEGCEYVVVDWYWQTYDENGVLVDEAYLYSTEELLCLNGGGGGGSGGGTGDPLTIGDLPGILYGTADLFPVRLPQEVLSQTASSRLARYRTVVWFNNMNSPMGLGSFQYKLTSIDLGSYFLNSNNKWVWEYFNHNTMSLTGWTTGIVDVSYIDNTGAQPAVIQNGGFGFYTYQTATMSVTYDVKTSLFFNGAPVYFSEPYSGGYHYTTPITFENPY